MLANRHLLAAGGTEVHLVTVGEQLRRLGHEVWLFAPELGPFAEHARRRGLEVHHDLHQLPAACEVVLAQDAIVVCGLAERYPQALLIFRVCGDVFDFQLPPQLEALVDLVVVLSDRYERIARACAVDVPLLRLRVPIDVDRLVPLGALRERPRRAVLLGNYADRDELVREVWGARGVEVERVGGAVQSYDVAATVADADIVVAKSRAALDAMACGRAVYVYDTFGGDGWVTPDSYVAMEADHFAGQATSRIIDAAALADDLAGYRPQMGAVNRDLVLQHHHARDHVVALLAAIADRVPQDRQQRATAPLREIARLIALQWSWEQTAREFRSMHWPLREHAARSEQRSLAAAEAERGAVEESRRAAEAARQAADDARQAERQRDDAVARARQSEETIEELHRVVEDLRAEAASLRARLTELSSENAWVVGTGTWRARRRLLAIPGVRRLYRALSRRRDAQAR